MSRADWTARDHAEYDALLEKSYLRGWDTASRVAAYEILLALAVRGGRRWALDLRREAIREGLARLVGRMAELREKHPHTTTVGEALAAEGVSLDQWLGTEASA